MSTLTLHRWGVERAVDIPLNIDCNMLWGWAHLTPYARLRPCVGVHLNDGAVVGDARRRAGAVLAALPIDRQQRRPVRATPQAGDDVHRPGKGKHCGMRHEGAAARRGLKERLGAQLRLGTREIGWAYLPP